MAKPVILYIPGLLSTGYLHSASLKLRLFFLSRNYDFSVIHAKPAGSIEERAQPIFMAISQIINSDIHLVGHSMAGLSCRYVANRLTGISTLTTISTPHHGSIFADKYVKDPKPLPNDTDFEQAYKQLTSAHMEQWNRLYPDNPQVKYFSMGFTNDIMVTPSSARWGTYLGTWDCSHLKQVSPYFGGRFTETFKTVLDNLDSL